MGGIRVRPSLEKLTFFRRGGDTLQQLVACNKWQIRCVSIQRKKFCGVTAGKGILEVDRVKLSGTRRKKKAL